MVSQAIMNKLLVGAVLLALLAGERVVEGAARRARERG
jgi:hypothetical protein